MAHVQDLNKAHWDEHGKNIAWLKVKGNELIIAE
jgi:hypothetical protein